MPMTLLRLNCLLGLLSVLMGLSLCSVAIAQIDSPTYMAHVMPAPQLEQVRALAELTVLEVPLTLPIRHHIRGRTGGTSVVLLLQGSARLSTNLAAAEFVQVDSAKRCVTLALPEPRAQSVELDIDSSPVLATQRRGLWRLVPGPAHEGTAVAAALREGQNSIHQAAHDPALIHRAKAQAEKVIGDFLLNAGWSASFHWAVVSAD